MGEPSVSCQSLKYGGEGGILKCKYSRKNTIKSLVQLLFAKPALVHFTCLSKEIQDFHA